MARIIRVRIETNGSQEAGPKSLQHLWGEKYWQKQVKKTAPSGASDGSRKIEKL